MGFAVATPKQIRDTMKVEGLTNDEVKSHLQVHANEKYIYITASIIELVKNHIYICMVSEIQATYQKAPRLLRWDSVDGCMRRR